MTLRRTFTRKSGGDVCFSDVKIRRFRKMRTPSGPAGLKIPREPMGTKSSGRGQKPVERFASTDPALVRLVQETAKVRLPDLPCSRFHFFFKLSFAPTRVAQKQTQAPRIAAQKVLDLL